MADSSGVVFPVSNTDRMNGGAEGADQRRSSAAFGRGVVAEALAVADEIGAEAVLRDTGWRRDYHRHFRRLVEVTATDPSVAVDVARAGLAAVGDRMRWLPADARHDVDLSAAFERSSQEPLELVRVEGQGAREEQLTLPNRGSRLAGADLLARLDRWVADGVVEPGVRSAVAAVLDNPDWLDLRGHTVAVLGAGAEMGPLRSLLRWGADVVAVDLPRPGLWQGVLDLVPPTAGALLVPAAAGEGDLADRAGADLLHDLGRVAQLLESIDGPLVLGNYVYADGGTNLRLSAATDALATRLLERRDDVALAYLATPTDTFVVPAEAVAAANAGLDSAFLRRSRGPLRALSRGKLLQRQYPPVEGPGISDSVVVQQGPNYLLAKRIHRWRATAAAADGRLVSMNIAPPTRTRSVTKNRALAAAYAGAHRFGIEVFDPSTANTLMAALLVHDLNTGGYAAHGDALAGEAAGAAHGGLWRTAYDPRSALGIAALLGVAATF